MYMIFALNDKQTLASIDYNISHFSKKGALLYSIIQC